MSEGNRNLVTRVITAIVLLPVVIYLIILGGLWFALLIAVAAAISALELNLLPSQLPVERPRAPAEDLSRKQRKKLARAVEEEIEEIEVESAVVSGGAIASIGGAFLIPLLGVVSLAFLTPSAVVVGVVIVAFTDALLFEDDLARAPQRVGLAVLGTAYPGLMLATLVPLREADHGIAWIVLTLTVTWMNDTGAYFAGRSFGRRKLYERISPSKTLEGAIGGAVASIVGALVVRSLWLADVLPAWAAAGIGLGAAILGPVGDLSESLLKRAFGAKDSGRLLPGHGGLLDRIDALLFNAPFVLFCARLVEGLR